MIDRRDAMPEGHKETCQPHSKGSRPRAGVRLGPVAPDGNASVWYPSTHCSSHTSFLFAEMTYASGALLCVSDLGLAIRGIERKCRWFWLFTLACDVTCAHTRSRCGLQQQVFTKSPCGAIPTALPWWSRRTQRNRWIYRILQSNGSARLSMLRMALQITLRGRAGGRRKGREGKMVGRLGLGFSRDMGVS